MKKKLSITLFASLLIASMCGCSSSKEPVVQEITKEVSQESTQELVVETVAESIETDSSTEVIESEEIEESTTEVETETEEATTEEVVESWYSQNADLFTPVGPAYYEMIQYTADKEAGIMYDYSFFDAPVTKAEITEESNGDGTKKIFFKYTFDLSQWSWDYQSKTYSWSTFDVETGIEIPSESNILESGFKVEDFPMYSTYESDIHTNDTVEDVILTIHCPEDFCSAGLALGAVNIDTLFEKNPLTKEQLINSHIDEIHEREDYWKEKGEDFSILFFTNYQPLE